jgi:transcriptional regulator
MKSRKQQEADARQWRRQKILDLKIQGYSQVEIAKELQPSNHVVSSDVSWLREQAAKTRNKLVTVFLSVVVVVVVSLSSHQSPCRL